MRLAIRQNADHDYLLWGAFAILLALGAVAVLSATVDLSARRFGSPLTMALRQWTALTVGLLLLWINSRLPISLWRSLRGVLFLLGITLLALVLVPGIGVEINGSRRWLNLPGLSFQPSEFMKFAFIIFMAGFIEKFALPLRSDWRCVTRILFLPLAGALGLLYLEPDAGAMAGIVAIVMGMMFFAGANLLGYLALTAIVATLAAGLLLLDPGYRLDRVLTFSDPWRYYLDQGYQVSNALMAISEGGWFGTGVGNSVQKIGFLPEQYSDFIIAVVIEETGFAGLVLVIGLYGVLLWRLFVLCLKSWTVHKIFWGALPLGASLWILFQVLVNVGGAFGVIPPKGLVLPFISYGGSNMVVMCAMFGIIARVDRKVRALA